MKFTYKNQEGAITVSYPQSLHIYAHFKHIFAEMCRLYAFSALKPKVQDVSGLPTALVKLIELYNYESYLDEIRYLSNASYVSKVTEFCNFELIDFRSTVFLTGGMDSVHVLLRLLETKHRNRPEEIQCIYVSNINKATSNYEKKSVAAICERLGVQCHIIDASFSIRPSYEGHNIGLREQMNVVLALPYILNFRSKNLYFGLYKDFDDIESALVTSNKKCFELLGTYLNLSHHIDLNFFNHPDWPNITELQATRDVVKRYRDMLPLVSSCYTQINWREQCHERMTERFKGVELSNGCGYCIKCLKINSQIFLEYYRENEDLRKFILGELLKSKFDSEEIRPVLIRDLTSVSS